MKNILIIIVILAAAIGLYYWNANTTAPTNTEAAVYQDPDLPISFKYKAGPDGYIVGTIGPSENIPNLIKTIVVLLLSDYESIARGEREGGEGPPAITIQAFRNPENLEPRAWIENNPQLSNFALITSEILDTEVRERVAISYSADGLYPNRNVVFKDGDLIYYISGSYMDQNSALYRDFPLLLDSIEL